MKGTAYRGKEVKLFMFQDALTFIQNYMHRNGGNVTLWYAGITDNPEKRLFEEHSVSKTAPWAYYPCTNADIARQVESFLINTLGARGGSGGGDENSVFVYAYKTAYNTREDY